jgi:hypothetical protein
MKRFKTEIIYIIALIAITSLNYVDHQRYALERELGYKVNNMSNGAFLGRGVGYMEGWIYTESDTNSDYATLKEGRGKTAIDAINNAKTFEGI